MGTAGRVPVGQVDCYNEKIKARGHYTQMCQSTRSCQVATQRKEQYSTATVILRRLLVQENDGGKSKDNCKGAAQ